MPQLTRGDVVFFDTPEPVLALRREFKLTLPIIAMTAGVLASERDRCVEAGITDFIPKPVVVEEMMAVIQRHLPGERSREALPALTAPAAAPAAAMTSSDGLAAAEPLFNMDSLVRVMGKDPKGRQVMFKMVRGALEGGMQPMDEADRALREGRAGDAAQVLHSMRGAIGVLGAKRLIRATLEAESAISQQRTGELPARFAEVRGVLEATLREAADWLERTDR
eukprot:gene27004-33660_t